MTDGPMTHDSEDPAELRRQIHDLQAALGAISSGGVDAVVVGPAGEEQVYTLDSADRPYRVIVENMGEGAATVSDNGVVLYANDRFAELLDRERASLIGGRLTLFFGEGHRDIVAELFSTAAGETRRAELHLTGAGQKPVPVLVSVTGLDMDGALVRCAMVTDLTTKKRVDEQVALAAARDLQRRHNQEVAREVNDALVQGLVAAEMALDLEDHERARALISRTSARARRWIGELVDEDRLKPGMAVRRNPAEPGVEPR